MKRHRFDPFSFVFGALFLIIGATFMAGGEGIHAVRAVRLWPATIVVIGLTLAIWAAGRAIHREPAVAVSSPMKADTSRDGAGEVADEAAPTDTSIDLDVGSRATDDDAP